LRFSFEGPNTNILRFAQWRHLYVNAKGGLN